MDSEEPRLLWIEFKPAQGQISVNHHFEAFLDSTGHMPLSATVLQKPCITARDSNHRPVLLSVGDTMVTKPAYVNLFCQAMIGPGYARPWFGPVILASLDGATNSKGLPTRLADVTCHDLRQVVYYIKTQSSNPGVPSPQSRWFSTIPALVLYDLDDEFIRAMKVKRDLEETNTSPFHMERPTAATTLAMFLGLSWYIRDGNSLATATGRDWNVPHAKYMGHVSQATLVQNHCRIRHKL